MVGSQAPMPGAQMREVQGVGVEGLGVQGSRLRGLGV